MELVEESLLSLSYIYIVIMLMSKLFVSLVNNCLKIFSPSVYLAGGASEAGGVEHGEGPQLGRHHGDTASGVLVRARQKYLSSPKIFCSPAGRYGFVTGGRGAGGPHLARVEHVSHVQRHVVTGRDKCVVADLDTVVVSSR